MKLRSLPAAWLLGVAVAAAAAPPTPRGSPASSTCRDALDALRRQEDRMLAASVASAEAARGPMLQARRAAAMACLGEAGDEGPHRTPGSASTPQPDLPRRPLISPAMPQTRPLPPAVQPPPPRSLTTCDANGCWTSDGLRLQRVGPQLLGPRGFCSTAGTAVQCP